MNILVVSSYLPYPLHSGGHIRLYNLLKELSKKHTITLVCEMRAYQTQHDLSQLKVFCKEVIAVERKKQWSLQNIIKTGLSAKPFLLVGHDNAEMKNAIGSLLQKNTYDVIHVETFYVMQNVPKTLIPIVLVEHNIEYLVYGRYVSTLPVFLRPFLSIDIAKMKYWEEHYWKNAAALVAVSESEKKLMKKDAVVVPNGVDTTKFQISNVISQKKAEKRILFIGDFKWIQNRDSVTWILKDIWPKIVSKVKAKKPNYSLKLWIVGKHIPESIKKLTNDHNVFFDENAPEETEQIFANADVLLAPIRVGGGTSYKILEAMASGCIVVTTALGIEGIDALHEKEVFLAENAEDVANVSVKALFDPGEAIKHARAFVADRYEWKEIAKKLDRVYLSVITP